MRNSILGALIVFAVTSCWSAPDEGSTDLVITADFRGTIEGQALPLTSEYYSLDDLPSLKSDFEASMSQKTAYERCQSASTGICERISNPESSIISNLANATQARDIQLRSVILTCTWSQHASRLTTREAKTQTWKIQRDCF